MAIPDNNNNGTSFLILVNEILCFVIIKYTAINRAASIARYKANSPDDTGIFLTKIPNVPNMVIETININRGFFSFFI